MECLNTTWHIDILPIFPVHFCTHPPTTYLHSCEVLRSSFHPVIAHLSVSLAFVSAPDKKKDDAKVFHEMDAFLGRDGGAIRLVPVRVLTGGAPPSQLPIPAKRRDGERIKDAVRSWSLL